MGGKLSTFTSKFVNSYIDFDDIEEPVKFFIDDDYYFPIDIGSQTEVNMFIREAELQRQDNWLFGFPSAEPDRVHLLKRIRTINAPFAYKKIGTEEDRLFRIFIRKDDFRELNTRKVYNIYNWLADVGGLSRSVIISFSSVADLFSTDMFFAALLSFVYCVRPPQIVALASDEKRKR